MLVMQEGSKQYFHQARSATVVGMVVNLLLAAFKLWAGVVGHSAAAFADGLESLSDIASSAFLYVGFRLAAKEADLEHPYGHGKAEPILGTVVAFALVGVAVAIAHGAIGRIRSTYLVVPGMIALVATITTIVVKEALFRYKFWMGRKLDSPALIAEAWHHRSDAFSSVATMIGIAGAILGGPRFAILDPVAALVVAGIIVWVGLRVFRETSEKLMDARAPEKVIDEIRQAILQVEGVAGVEKLRVRRSGFDYYVDVHVEVKGDMTVEKSHHVAQRAREEVSAKIPKVKDMLVHIEPYFPDDH